MSDNPNHNTMTTDMQDLFNNLESACGSAHGMKRTGEMSEEQYQQINNTIAGWENMLREIHASQLPPTVELTDIRGNTIHVEPLSAKHRENFAVEYRNSPLPFATGYDCIVVPHGSADRFAYMTGLSEYDEKPTQYIDPLTDIVFAVWCMDDHEREDEDGRIQHILDWINDGPEESA
tara:strand:+ start:2827 stop:3357 length:531 start_codon:yes stop_codon:yes gene_type:complete